MSTIIELRAKKRIRKRYKRIADDIFYNKDIKVIECTGNNMFKHMDAQAMLILLCIDDMWDVLRYLYYRNRLESSKVLIISGQALVAYIIFQLLSCRVIYCRKNETSRVVERIMQTIGYIGLLELNYVDFLQICSHGPVWYEGCSGPKEMVLFKMSKEWAMREKGTCCLISVVGGITVQDVSDVCAVIPTTDDACLGLRYDDVEEVRVFSLWRKAN